jgi:hypothetical protein
MLGASREYAVRRSGPKTVGPAVATAIAITAWANTDPDFRTLVNVAALHTLEPKQNANVLSCRSPQGTTCLGLRVVRC